MEKRVAVMLRVRRVAGAAGVGYKYERVKERRQKGKKQGRR